jgi:hypothetical protein
MFRSNNRTAAPAAIYATTGTPGRINIVAIAQIIVGCAPCMAVAANGGALRDRSQHMGVALEKRNVLLAAPPVREIVPVAAC